MGLPRLSHPCDLATCPNGDRDERYFTSAVDADDGTDDFKLGNVAVGTNDTRAENRLIEIRRSRQVGGLDDMLDALDVHLSKQRFRRP